MKRLLPALLATLVTVAAATPAAASTQRLLVVLTSPDTETQAMSLVLANQSQRTGTAVHLLLCGPAGDIALATPPASASEVVTPKGMTVLALLDALKDGGARVDVCAIYLPNRRLGIEALAAGVGVATPPDIAAEMLADDTRLFTF